MYEVYSTPFKVLDENGEYIHLSATLIEGMDGRFAQIQFSDGKLFLALNETATDKINKAYQSLGLKESLSHHEYVVLVDYIKCVCEDKAC